MSEDIRKLTRIESLGDFEEANARIMEEIYNDGSLSADKRMKGIKDAVLNQVRISGEVRKRVELAAKLGMKNSDAKALSWTPESK